MPTEEFSKIFDACKYEVTNLHYRWILYRQLFATNTDRLDIMNRTASNPMSELQNLLLDAVVLTLCKLTDPPNMGRHRNLSLPQLEKLVAASKNYELLNQLSPQLECLLKQCNKFRNLRHKKLAHLDLATHKDFIDLPLPGVSREEVEIALNTLRNYMNSIELNICGSQTLYNECIMPLTNDGRALIIWLQKGLAYQALEDKGTVANGFWRGFGKIDK